MTLDTTTANVRTTIAGYTALAAVAISVLAGITTGVVSGQAAHNERMTSCVEAGGDWILAYQGRYQCEGVPMPDEFGGEW